mmetsp:Transcript_3306/g.6764  ORF Transcript_3306/g.6764 Transcript_3306/m.6764 type:complete len:495 (-) Transcript_3306:586-2070(-)
MANPSPINLQNVALQFTALPDIVPVTSFFPKSYPLSSWEDLVALKDKMAQTSPAKTLSDLETYTKILSNKRTPSSIEAVLLPLALSGINLDATSINTKGIECLVALAAITAVKPDVAEPQVMILVQNSASADSLKAEIGGLCSVKVGGLEDKAAQILIGIAADASKATIETLNLFVCTEIDKICAAGQDAAAKQVLSAAKGRQILTFCSEMLLSQDGPHAQKIRNLQNAGIGSASFVQAEDGTDLKDVLQRLRLQLKAKQLAEMGAYDMASLRNVDPQALNQAFGVPVANKIAAEVERWERAQGRDGAVPPFDMASGLWEWTPDTVESWVAKGLDRKFFHEEGPNSRWILCAASQALFAKGAAAPAPWELDPQLTPGGIDEYEGDADADAAWEEMFGSGAAGGEGGGGGVNDMGGLGRALPVDLSSLPPELAALLARIDPSVSSPAVATLAAAFQRANVKSLGDLQGMRWTMTSSLGIDYALAAEVSQALDASP